MTCVRVKTLYAEILIFGGWRKGNGKYYRCIDYSCSSFMYCPYGPKTSKDMNKLITS